MKRTLTSLVASSCLKFVPKHYRPYVKTGGNELIEVSLAMRQASTVVRGFLFGKHLNGCDRIGAPVDGQSSLSRSDSLNALETYFESHTEGAGIWKWRHYFEIYDIYFSKFIGREVHVLEIGVYSGGSLAMWRNYFGPKSNIYGVDIMEACKAYEDHSIKILVGDQADREFWRRFKAEVPVVDIVIDDGGHAPHQQIVTLEELLPHLRPGGIYMCEDVHGVFNRFHTYVNGLTHNLNYVGKNPGAKELASLPNPFQRMIRAVHLYPFVTVIERSEMPVSEFVAPKHGTQWQPFLCKEK